MKGFWRAANEGATGIKGFFNVVANVKMRVKVSLAKLTTF